MADGGPFRKITVHNSNKLLIVYIVIKIVSIVKAPFESHIGEGILVRCREVAFTQIDPLAAWLCLLYLCANWFYFSDIRHFGRGFATFLFFVGRLLCCTFDSAALCMSSMRTAFALLIEVIFRNRYGSTGKFIILLY